MAQVANPIVPHWLLTGLCWLLALEFLILAPLKFWPRGIGSWPSYPEKFRSWGFPPWFSFVVGAGEVFAGLMLLLLPRRFLGATILIITLVGGMVTHQINHDKLTDSISAPIHFILAVIVALSTWPHDWRAPLSVSEPRPAYVSSSMLDSAQLQRYPGPAIPLSSRQARLATGPEGVTVPAATTEDDLPPGAAPARPD